MVYAEGDIPKCMSQGARPTQLGRLTRVTRWLPGPSLDANPVFWLECRRTGPSPWLTIVSVSFWAVATSACFYSAYTIWTHGAAPTKVTAPAMRLGAARGSLVGFLRFADLSAAAPLSASAERRQNGLDMLVVTPLSTRSIMLAKWLATWRLVPLLTIGPGVDMLALAAGTDQEFSVRFRLVRLGLMLATIVVHGALLTSVGLALATWIEQQGRAIAMSVSSIRARGHRVANLCLLGRQ